MNFSQGVEYELTLNLHSKVMLAFRYGIAIEGQCVSAFFEGYLKSSNTEDSSERLKCKFNIEGHKVLAVMQNRMLVTALPTSRIYDTADAKSVVVGFDFALAMAPDLFTMQEVVDWRDDYLDSNGGITKDDLRREIKKRAPDQRDPMELLGLHDSFFDEVKELREMASRKSLELALEETRLIDFSLGEKARKKVQEPSERLKSLAKTELTTLYQETELYATELRREWAEHKNSDEYKRELQLEHEQTMRDLLIDEITRGARDQQEIDLYFQSDDYLNLDEISRAQKKKKYHEFMQKHNSVWVSRVKQRNDFIEQWDVYRQSSEYQKLDINTKELKRLGFEEQLDKIYPLESKNSVDSSFSGESEPEKSEPKVGIPDGGERYTSYNNKEVYCHADCEVTDVYINPRNDGWHEIHYENATQRFITTTKQAFIVDTYKIGQRGVWTISYDKGRVNYIQPFGGSPGEVGDFYHCPEFLRLRYLAIKRSAGHCEACGSKEKIHVDHIKPRSLYPKLELELSNLQVLCQKCNSGKGNTDETDFRTS
jgi:hypothetical protein|tara:strand:- start:10816 stop:12435 length:1620 start_codon:yes stop_codon:yes gene_type:complete